jgi:tRNA pseudouridine32 synthase/23S rRNA pseudouridine746 synthase
MALVPEILFQSNHVLIINKPAGLACHPGPSGAKRGGPSVEDFFPLWRRGHDGPWLAHRLDTDTAGCLMVARRKTALRAIQDGFRTGAVRKMYAAIVRGVPGAASGVIEAPLTKLNDVTGWRMVVDPAGQAARTAWRVWAVAAGRALLELRPETGRTHQLRVHCASIGHPIIGDLVYGAGAAGEGASGEGAPGEAVGGLSLLARQLDLVLQGVAIHAEAPWSPAMRAAWRETLPDR